jgi:hypothetical protein
VPRPEEAVAIKSIDSYRRSALHHTIQLPIVPIVPVQVGAPRREVCEDNIELGIRTRAPIGTDLRLIRDRRRHKDQQEEPAERLHFYFYLIGSIIAEYSV